MFYAHVQFVRRTRDTNNLILVNVDYCGSWLRNISRIEFGVIIVHVLLWSWQTLVSSRICLYLGRNNSLIRNQNTRRHVSILLVCLSCCEITGRQGIWESVSMYNNHHFYLLLLGMYSVV